MIAELVRSHRVRELAWEATCERLAAMVLRTERHAAGILEGCEALTTHVTGLEPNGRDVEAA